MHIDRYRRLMIMLQCVFYQCCHENHNICHIMIILESHVHHRYAHAASAQNFPRQHKSPDETDTGGDLEAQSNETL